MQSCDPEEFIRGLRINTGSCNAMELLIPAVFTYWPNEVLCHRMDSNVVLFLCSATWVFAMPWLKQPNLTSAMVACPPTNSAGAHLKHRIIEMVLYLITCLRHRSARHTRHAPGVSHLGSQVATAWVRAKVWRSDMEQEMQSYDPEEFIRGLRINTYRILQRDGTSHHSSLYVLAKRAPLPSHGFECVFALFLGHVGVCYAPPPAICLVTCARRSPSV